MTHPEIIRYFMTIPKPLAWLSRPAPCRGGEIFILDMGQPVKIADLARDVIRLSGYEPDVDIPIRYTGLRPGEKLYEELLMDEEGLQPTADKKIFIGRSIDIDYQELMTSLDRLEKLLVEGSDDEIRNQMQQLVPTYNPFVIFDDSVETAVMS